MFKLSKDTKLFLKERKKKKLTFASTHLGGGSDSSNGAAAAKEITWIVFWKFSKMFVWMARLFCLLNTISDWFDEATLNWMGMKERG